MAEPLKDTSETVVSILEKLQSAIYLLVSVFLVVMALMALYTVSWDLWVFITESFELTDLVKALQDLLTVLILAELIQTVVVYFKSHQLDLKLILVAGMTAMIRRILVFGAEKNTDPLEMIVIAALIIIIAVSIVIIDRNEHTRM